MARMLRTPKAMIAGALSLAFLSPAATGPVDAQTSSAARDWIVNAGQRTGTWRDHGRLALPSGRLFVGDPTWGDAYHLRGAKPAPADAVHVWSFGKGRNGLNYAIWLELAGTTPVKRGEMLEFGVDAAVLALGDYATGQAMVDLGDALIDAGKGDSFDWISPHIQASANFAKWLPIPPQGQQMFLATTNNDGGYGAAWLYDDAGALSGVLIDLRGRASDQTFLDVLLKDGS
ncbi:MAG: hypothetical protein AB8B82_04985 [Roseovarius sp.]